MKKRKNPYQHFFAILLFIVVLSGCKEKQDLPVDMGYRYFPVQIGHWVAYQVDSIVYNDFTQTVDTFRYQIKEYIESEFLDNQGRPTQRLERYIRFNDTSEWRIKNVWVINRTITTAEKVEENLRFIKLVFPIKPGAEWDGNNYNTLGSQMYKYKDVFTAKTINNIYLDSTVTVLQKSQYTLISENFQQEIYAAGIGMVYKKYVSLTKEPTGVITKGVDYSYTLISYGN